MLNEYIRALLLIFAAEMGDKTQILAMMFATKYKTGKVLIGIMVGSLLNHGIAVALGTFLGNVIPIHILQMTAGIAFIGFALWTLMTDDDDEDESSETKSRSAVIVVAMAFFVGELGDKTQLTAITLSLDAAYPLAILLGTVSGMVLTSSLGIFVGSKIGDRMPEVLIKILSSTLFLIFGTTKLISATPISMVSPVSLTVFALAVGMATVLLLRTAVKAHQSGTLTPFRRAAKNLYDYAHRLEITADEVCRGVKHCGQCQGEQCAVGFILHLAREIKANEYDHDHSDLIKGIRYYEGKFSKEKLLQVRKLNQSWLDVNTQKSPGYSEVLLMQQIVERMLSGSK